MNGTSTTKAATIETSSPVVSTFRGSIFFGLLIASPLILAGLIDLIGDFLHISGAIMGLVGVMVVVLGFAGIVIYYYTSASELLGKTAMNKLHWETPSKDKGYVATFDDERKEYLGVLKTNPRIHATYYAFREDEIPDELMLSPAHPNEIEGQPKKSWIPYRHLIYPASVVSVDTVELRKTTFGIPEEAPFIVTWAVASPWHATQVQRQANRLMSGKEMEIGNPSPTMKEVGEAIHLAVDSRVLEFREKWIQSEAQLQAYKNITKDFKKRIAETTTELDDLKGEISKSPTETIAGKLLGTPLRRKLAVIAIISGAIVGAIAIFFYITGTPPPPPP